jgi:hypothetical protein
LWSIAFSAEAETAHAQGSTQIPQQKTTQEMRAVAATGRQMGLVACYLEQEKKSKPTGLSKLTVALDLRFAQHGCDAIVCVA